LTKHYLLIGIIITLFVQACAPLKYPKRNDLVGLKTDPAKINGEYKNMASDSTPSIWSVLTKNYSYPGFDSVFDIPNATVRFTAKNKRTILAQFYVDSTLREEKVLKGRLRGNYFRRRTRFTYFGIPFIIMKYSEYKLQFSRQISGRLNIDVAAGIAGSFLFFAAGNDQDYNFVYESR
jgi:hypothetical protein